MDGPKDESGHESVAKWPIISSRYSRREPQAFFGTDPDMDPVQIIAIFVKRWQIEVTFAELRAHLGGETQRQWSDLAIERTTPVLLGLHSLICIWAGDLLTGAHTPYAAAWYRKISFTFTDAIAALRYEIWLGETFQHSPPEREAQQIPPDKVKRMLQALCFAA